MSERGLYKLFLVFGVSDDGPELTEDHIVHRAPPFYLCTSQSLCLDPAVVGRELPMVSERSRVELLNEVV